MARWAHHLSTCTRQGRHSKFECVPTCNVHRKDMSQKVRYRAIQLIGELLLLAGPTVVNGQKPKKQTKKTRKNSHSTKRIFVVIRTDPTTILSVLLDMRCKAQQVGPYLH